jgi:hypothetical protein
LKNIFTAEAQRTQRILFFIKSGVTDFMKSRCQRDAASGRLRLREAMSGFPLKVSPAKEKIMVLCVLGVSAVLKPLKNPF